MPWKIPAQAGGERSGNNSAVREELFGVQRLVLESHEVERTQIKSVILSEACSSRSGLHAQSKDPDEVVRSYGIVGNSPAELIRGENPVQPVCSDLVPRGPSTCR